ncbi:MAG: FKBP-type peptidyl-prolyl cis-trans isomerase [Patescibacteria group bacterium]
MKNQKGNTSVIVSFIIVAGIIGLVVYSLMRKTASTNIEEDSYKSTEVNENTNNNQEVKKDTSQKPMEQNKRLLSDFTPVANVATLQKIDLVTGTGTEVKAGATVSVHYTGAVASTGAVFQSSKDFGSEPITFPLSGVIKGWTDGIPGMKVGGTRRLIIPSAQAYGANPPGGSGIPANADLVFDVELVNVK